VPLERKLRDWSQACDHHIRIAGNMPLSGENAMPNPIAHLLVVRALLIALLASIAIVPTVAAQESSGEMTPVEVVDQVGPAVVTVINEQTVTTQFGTQETQQVGAGTGFVIDEEGHIVTNWHVVTGGTSFVAILSDGTEVPAELIGEDPRDDLAVVKIDSSAVLATVPLGDSSQLQVGQSVLAIGSPLGAFGNTVTGGIVSALNRDQLGGEGICQNYSDLIQHDAAINQGNSVGPLFNLKGEVVGVNTLGIPLSQNNVPVQGLFFAVPVNTVKVVVDQMIQTGTISAPYLGISFQTINPQIAAANQLPIDHGLYVLDLEQAGPAAEAGIQPDDIILALDGEDVTPMNTLATMLLDYAPGDTVELTVQRGGEEITIDLVLGEAPQELFEQCTLQGQGQP
jgi:S1-C subfamily serine protease